MIYCEFRQKSSQRKPYVAAYNNLYLHLASFLSEVDKIWYEASAYNDVELFCF